MRVNCVIVDLGARVCLCELLVVGRWLWVVEKYEPIRCRVTSAEHPVVVVPLSFVGVQEGVSRHLILFVICGPAETQMLRTERQQARRCCNMTFSCHIGGPDLLSGCEELTATWACQQRIIVRLFVWVKKADSSQATTHSCLGFDWDINRFFKSL